MKKVIFSMLALFCAAFAFTSCEDVPMPYDQPGEGGEDPVVVEPTGDGTLENPYNVAAVLELVNNLSADVEYDHDIYIKGKVVTILEEYGKQYGNATFYISDDGTNKNQFEVYQAYYLGNKKYTGAEEEKQIQEGDDVIICGRVVNFRGTTPETAARKAFLYSLNGETKGGGGGSGTVTEITCTKAVELTNALGDNDTSSETYAVTGYITEVVGSVSKNQQTFWMADTKDGGRVFEAYWANLPEGVSEFKKGSKVKITGNLIKYVNASGMVTPEIKNANVVILEDGGGDTPSGEAKGSGTLDDPFNPVAANNYATSLGSDVKSDKDVYVKGKISRVVEKYGTQFGNATFYISEDGSQSNEFYVFRALYLNNEKYASGDNINVGDEVIVCGKVVNYKGNTPETVQNEAYLYSLNSAGSGGGETTGNVTKTVDGSNVILVVANTTEGDKITVDLSAQGWESGKAVDPATITLSDGTKITFAKGEGSNTPAFYEATKGVRVYAKNTITISGKAVAKVVMTCDVYNGTAYTGNSTLYASASGTTFVICNEHSEAKGGDQLRVQTIEITYAK